MSIGKINTLGDLFARIKDLEEKGLTPDEIFKHLKELVESELVKYFGRYESSSGRLWFEMYQHSESQESGAVVFRKGEKGKDKLEEDLIIPRSEALKRFRQLASKGYWPVFSARTKSEMDEANEQLIRGNEDILGLFINDKAFIRVDCYGENYSLQRGYAGTMTSAVHEKTEAEARQFVNDALEGGYHREGELPKVKDTDAPAWYLAELNLD